MGDAVGALPPAVVGWGLMVLGAWALGRLIVECVRRGRD